MGAVVAAGALIAAVVLIVVNSSSSTSGSARSKHEPSPRPGVFARVPGRYDDALRRAFPGQRFQVTFGDRTPSAPSSESYSTLATRDATGLLRATTANGDVVALDLMPVPAGFTLTDSDTGFRSTAVALIAMSPGLLTADPYADLLLLREISQLSEVDDLSAQLRHSAAVHGSGYLDRASPEIVKTLAGAVDDLQSRELFFELARVQNDPGGVTEAGGPYPTTGPSSPVSPQPASSWAGPAAVAQPNHPPSCDGAGLQPVGGFEGDEICLTALDDQAPPDAEEEQVAVRAVNRAPRWATVSRPNGNDVWPSGLIAPKTWSVPGLSDLLGAVADAVANSSDANAFKGGAAWLDQIIGVDYHPYYGADDFLTALNLSLRRFASDSVSDLTLTPDESRQLQSLTLGQPWSDDPGAPPSTSGWQGLLPSLLTFYDGIVKPLVLIVMDIKSAVEGAKDAADTAQHKQQEEEAAKAGVIRPAAFCKRADEGKHAYSAKKVLYTCRKDRAGLTQWLRPLDSAAVGDATAANNDDCMQHYLDLATDLGKPLADLGNSVTGSGDSSLLSSLGDVLGAVVKNPNALGCLMSHALFNAAKDGTLGDAAREAASTLAENSVDTIDGLVTLIQHGAGVGNLTAQALRGLFDSIVASVTETVVEKVTEKIALAIAPGGDLLVAVKLAEQADDITGLVLGLVDLVNAELNASNGSVYTFAAQADIRAVAELYPEEVGPDTGIAVPYAPTYWGDADWVRDTDGSDKARTGFWVSGNHQLDVFHADGTPDYTVRTAEIAGKSVLVKNTPASAAPVWTTVIAADSGQLGVPFDVVANDKTGNILTYDETGSGLRIFDGSTGALLTDVDAQYGKAGYHSTSLLGGPGWVDFADGTLLVTSLSGPSGGAAWSTSFAGGAGAAVPGASGGDVTAWSHEGASYVALDDRTLWRSTGAGSTTRAGSLSATPADSTEGIGDPMCGDTITYISDDGFVVRDHQDGSHAWTTHVDPGQGTDAGNRALVSVVDPGTCDVVAADDHGVITRFSGTGERPQTAWTTRYGYQPGPFDQVDAPEPVSDLQLTASAVLAVSNYDPHLTAFSLADGTRLYSYPLASKSLALSRLADGDLLAVGTEGELTLLSA